MKGNLLKVFEAVRVARKRSGKWPTTVDLASDLTIGTSAVKYMLQALEGLGLIKRKWSDEHAGQRRYIFILKDWVLEQLEEE